MFQIRKKQTNYFSDANIIAKYLMDKSLIQVFILVVMLVFVSRIGWVTSHGAKKTSIKLEDLDRLNDVKFAE